MTYNKNMLNFSFALPSVAWLAVLILSSIIEALSLSLTAIWFACGALVAFIFSLLGFSITVQSVCFLLVSCILLIFTRPIAVKFFKLKKTATNADSLIGQKCKLTKAISDLEKGSLVIKGITWSATTIGSQPIEEGAVCIIKEIQGNTLIVEKSE